MRFQTTLLSLIALILVFQDAYTQILGGNTNREPKVTWTVKPSKEDVSVGETIELIIKGKLEAGWHTYSVGFDEDCGPIPHTIIFSPHTSFEPVGKLQAIGDKEKFDDIFECDVRFFEKAAELRQKVKILGPEIKIEGEMEGQVCQDEGSCIPWTTDFTLTLHAKKTPEISPSNIKKPHPTPEDLNPASDTVKNDTSKINSYTKKKYGENKGPILDPSILEGDPSFGAESLWILLLISLVAGLTTLITPCVFPMIPMTVTFFLRDNQSRRQGIIKALVFSLSIIVLYSTAGTLFAVILGVDGLNALATNWILNLFIFVIFIVFALSFFGLFEITVPHQLVNKMDRQADKGGLIGIFFMATTLVLVSFSCTVPIVGTVLSLSGGGEIIKPILMMLAYSTALAIPFGIFALFPELIKGLPKSGGWLNSVKVVLAFIELGLSLKFLSVADLAYGWGVMDRDMNIGIWIVIGTLLGFYLIGKIRMPHDSPMEKVGVGRLLLAIGVFSFVVYLIPGLWGAPLKGLSGYLPPMYTHDFNLLEKNQSGIICHEEPKHTDKLHLPHGLSGYFDYDQALACAREQGKPLFIDFTGHGCQNCRKMEDIVWSDPMVLKKLQTDFVIVALYVDDRTLLPESEWYVSSVDGKIKKTIGKQNMDLEISNLDNPAQPYYVIVGEDEKVLAWPYAYDPDPVKFAEFLDAGIQKFQQLYGK